jgi:hypothetical protein
MVVGGRSGKRRVQENATGDTETGRAGAAFAPLWPGVSLVIPASSMSSLTLPMSDQNRAVRAIRSI